MSLPHWIASAKHKSVWKNSMEPLGVVRISTQCVPSVFVASIQLFHLSLGLRRQRVLSVLCVVTLSTSYKYP